MAARVADAEGGALILSKNNGQVALDQLHCQDNQINGELRRQLEAIIRQLNQEAALENRNSRSLLDSLDHQNPANSRTGYAGI
jgi:sigma-B regulation protein RsbU (phosphoserine phosphatase)